VLLVLQMEWVVYDIMCGYVACVPECRGSVRHNTNSQPHSRPLHTSPHSFRVMNLRRVSGARYVALVG
jgi:hypothetical protein